jgi:hypothetical protein
MPFDTIKRGVMTTVNLLDIYWSPLLTAFDCGDTEILSYNI